MKRLVAAALVFTLGLPGWAAEPPPPPPDDEAQARPMPSEMGYYEQCFGTPQPAPGGRFGIGLYGEVPISRGRRPDGPPIPSVSGRTADKPWLIVAVLAVDALPVVVSAL